MELVIESEREGVGDNRMPHQNKIALLKRRPSWNDKRRYCDDSTLPMFVWPHGTGELIDELKRVREILSIADRVRPSESMTQLEMDIAFEECFIDSHAMLITLMDRLVDYWNSHALQDILNLPDNSFDSVSASYKQANSMFNTTSDSLLKMRHLYEQLKPETRALIKQCSGPVQLERSMIAQKKEPARESSVDHVFQPACGFTLKAHSSTKKVGKEQKKKAGGVQVTTERRITAIDMEIERLLQEKNRLVQKLKDFEIRTVELEMYEVLQNLIAKGKAIEDPDLALQYANNAIAPQKHIIKLNSTSFKNMLRVLPKSYPSSWTCDDASEFFRSVSDALEQDLKTLTVTESDSDANL